MSALADRAQLNTMQYGKRPYGVGFLVMGVDDTGPHLYEFSPTGNCFEYYAMALGARSQSAKTYLERRMDQLEDADLDALVQHALRALRETLPQNKQLERAAVSVAVVGPGADADPNSPDVRKGQKFTLYEGDELAAWFDAYVSLLTSLGPTERERQRAEAAQTDTHAPTDAAEPPADAPASAPAPMDE